MLRGVGLVITILRPGIRIRRGRVTHRLVSVCFMSLLALSPSMTFAQKPSPDMTPVTVPAETLAHWRSKAAALLDTLQADPGYQARQAQARSQAFASLGLSESSTAVKSSVGDTSRQSDMRLYLFVSSSMPLATLRRYAADMVTIAPFAQVSMVLRGFIDGATKMGPTLHFVHRVLRRDAACDRPDCAVRPLDVQVDPLVFRRYGITRVPALVYVPDFVATGLCSEGTKRGATGGAAQVVYGDASLRYLLERLGETSPDLAALVRHLEQGPLEDQSL